MKTSTQELGRKGESLAAEFLQHNNHTIIDTNWRYSHLELDIVSLAQDGLHFVEVKSRRRSDIDPVENFTKAKQAAITRAANAYLHSSHKVRLPHDLEIFFDLITIIFDGEQAELQYFPQAFIPIYV